MENLGNRTIRVLLVDDHKLFRTGMRKILDEAEDISVIAEASSGESAIEMGADLRPDVVLMDIRMPGIGGIEATRRLTRVNPQIKVLALSALEEDPFPSRLNEAGAFGFLTKGCPVDEVIQAIRAVNEGQFYLDSRLVKRHMRADWEGKTAGSPFENLSSREMQVALKILDGKKNTQISDELNLSPKTISTYRQRIYEKLEIQSDVDLFRMALRYGLLDAD